MAKRGSSKPSPGAPARRVAIEAVRRIDEDNAYANLLVPSLLAQSDLEQRDRNLVTEIAYGATRMRRSLDWLVDRFLVSPPAPALRAALRVGAYQLAFMRIPPHAAVSATVEASAKRNRAPVNAILRKVAESLPVEWPTQGIRLSYPDWLIERLIADLGEADAVAMLECMNTSPPVTEREDGYRQDKASQWVAELVGARPGELVLDVCAAPGGKATALAATGAHIVAADLRATRTGLVASNVSALELPNVSVLTADGLAPPFAPQAFDRVLVDAPCSGFGVLRRRPDARWRISAKDVDELSVLQGRLLDEAVGLVRPGGTLVYSICTVTAAETRGVADAFAARHRNLALEPVIDERWERSDGRALILPQAYDTDGMAFFRWTVGSANDPAG